MEKKLSSASPIFKENEREANRYACRCLRVMALIALLMIPITALIGAFTRPTIPDQILPNILTTEFHAPCQLPVNTLVIESSRPCSAPIMF